ncbi:hypothetical protein LWI29_016394 [Acer saccharum]|uniref:Transposase MuDR plant domain-containing protein n=1 Tax=Acer saccharum TaxID=4024 RepID=A0AA39V7U9_ACESA|nr:hypothetical protein LWI29_016394 [Acer saccharum]
MVGERRNPDKVPEYGPDDLDIFFSFKVHYDGQFDVSMIQLPGYGKHYQIVCDEELLWFEDKIAENRVIDLNLECIQPLQAFRGDELILSQQPESQDLLYNHDEDNRATTYNKDNGAAEAVDIEEWPASFGNRPVGFGDEEGDEELTKEDAERAKSQRKNKGKYIVEEEEEAEADKDLPHGFGSDNNDGSKDLGSLDGSNGEEDAEGPVRKFIKKRYHEFNPRHDLQDPVFRLVMEFFRVDVFRKAIRAHYVKHKRIVKFKKNDPNRIRVVCKDEGCQLRANPDWNFVGMVEQLRSDTNMDASK